jgi:hypothetical protein
VIFERFFLRVRVPREEKRREEKRREEKRREERGKRGRVCSRGREELKKKKSGKRKDNRSPLVCLSQKVFGDESKHQNLFF